MSAAARRYILTGRHSFLGSASEATEGSLSFFETQYGFCTFPQDKGSVVSDAARQSPEENSPLCRQCLCFTSAASSSDPHNVPECFLLSHRQKCLFILKQRLPQDRGTCPGGTWGPATPHLPVWTAPCDGRAFLPFQQPTATRVRSQSAAPCSAHNESGVNQGLLIKPLSETPFCFVLHHQDEARGSDTHLGPSFCPTRRHRSPKTRPFPSSGFT